MAENTEPTVTHNGTTYKVADLPEDARKQFMNLQVAETEIRRLQMQLALAQTAKNAYEQALVKELPKE